MQLQLIPYRVHFLIFALSEKLYQYRPILHCSRVLFNFTEKVIY